VRFLPGAGEPGEVAVAREQIVVVAIFGDLGVDDHRDVVGSLHGRQTVRDDDHGAPRHQSLERVFDLGLLHFNN